MFQFSVDGVVMFGSTVLNPREKVKSD